MTNKKTIKSRLEALKLEKAIFIFATKFGVYSFSRNIRFQKFIIR